MTTALKNYQIHENNPIHIARVEPNGTARNIKKQSEGNQAQTKAYI